MKKLVFTTTCCALFPLFGSQATSASPAVPPANGYVQGQTIEYQYPPGRTTVKRWSHPVRRAPGGFPAGPFNGGWTPWGSGFPPPPMPGIGGYPPMPQPMPGFRPPPWPYGTAPRQSPLPQAPAVTCPMQNENALVADEQSFAVELQASGI